jgi:aldehyde dehydrogenase (NAD+)
LRQPLVSSDLVYRAAELKANFLTHKTKTYAWRQEQLNQFILGCQEMRPDFEQALQSDLGKCPLAGVTELLLMEAAARHDLKHLSTYMKDKHLETELLLAPATTVVRQEPYGVCAIFSAWNYPILTAYKPLIQCLTTGNAVIMKPSEIAPATSAVIKKMIDKYLDPDFIRCIEGGVDVAVELNK